jgi:predicted alpha/beta superfamily hydrolase
MIRRIVLAAALSLASLTQALAEPARPAGPPWTAEVSTPSTRRIQFTSAIDGESYTLAVRVPLTPPPPGGYPVIYVLDGDMLFGMASDIALTVGDPRRTPVVVSIGHGVFDNMEVVARHTSRPPSVTGPMTINDIGAAMNALRFHDLTLPVATEHRAPDWTGLTPKDVGGLDRFLKVIEAEIKPKVAAAVPVNTADQALFGHSIAGLAVVRALFTEPQAFRTFIAASPSLWWDADAVLAGEQAFEETVAAGRVHPRVLITVGAEEPDSPNPPASFVASLPADKAASLGAYLTMANHWSGMVSGSRDLAGRLGKVRGGDGYEVHFVAFDGESHASVQPAALSRGMHFAFDH